MNRIKVQKVPSVEGQLSKRELYATVCWYYPQYTLQEVAAMPARDVTLLLRIAQKMDAIRYQTLTQIAAAPHTKNGSGVKSLLKQFKDLIK